MALNLAYPNDLHQAMLAIKDLSAWSVDWRLYGVSDEGLDEVDFPVLVESVAVAELVEQGHAPAVAHAAFTEFARLGCLSRLPQSCEPTWEPDVVKLWAWYRENDPGSVVLVTSVNLDMNGPVPPRGFRFQGRDFSDLPPTAWKLVDALWRCKNRTASFEELRVPVFSEKNPEHFDLETVKSHAKFANRFFRQHAIAYHVTTDARTKYAKVVDGFPSGTAVE